MSKRSALNIPGIYTITNTVTGKVYVGQTTNVLIRWQGHCGGLRRGVHRNTYLQNAWNKHGANAFTFKVEKDMSNIPSHSLAAALNAAEIELLASLPETYNLMEAGVSGVVASAETRAILSKQRLELWADPEFRVRQSAAVKALYENTEWKAARDAAVKEAKSTSESRAAVSKHSLALWQDAKHRDEQSRKRKERWQDQAYREQQTASRRKAWADPEIRAKRLAGLEAAAANPEVLEARRIGQLRVLDQMSEAKKRNWQDPEWRKRVIAAQIAGRQRKKQSG